MYQVYVLKLENDKYFVGHTQSIENLQLQINKKKIEWINENPYVKILKVINKCDKFDVDKYTKKYMEVYGISKVRGGSYYQPELSPQIIEQITNEMEITNQEIYNEEDELKAEEDNDDPMEDSFDKIKGEFFIVNKCARCGNNDHYSYNCFVEFVPDGDIKRCSKCKEYGHLRKECPITKQQKILEKFQKVDNKIKDFVNKFMK